MLIQIPLGRLIGKKPMASKGAIGGKTSKTAVVPGFCKIQRRHAYIGVLSEAPVVP